MSSGVSVNGPCVCLGDREPSSDASSLGNAGTGGIYALWNALVLRDSPDGLGSAANETREVRVSAAKETRDTRSVEERAAGFRRPTPGRSCDMLRVDPTPAAFSASSPSAMNWLEGRMAPKEKEELRFPPSLETAIEFLMAACAPAAEMDFQSVEMVDMRLSTASLHRFRFSLFFARCILNHAATHKQMSKSGMRTPAAALPEMDFFFALDASFTGVTPESIWLTSAETGVPVEGAV